MSGTWRKVWAARGGCDGLSPLERAIRLDGFDNAGDQVPPASWRSYVLDLAEALGMRPGASVFEVGCGAGAFLLPLAEAGFAVGGIDYSPSLVEVGRSLIPGADLQVADAQDLDVESLYDHVISHSVFQYFAGEEVAREVVDRMTRKARLSVGIFDVADASTQALAEDARRSFEGEAYERKYAGLEHRYYDRNWFVDISERLDLTAEFRPSSLEGHRNSPYRFNVVMRPTNPSAG